MASQGKSSNPVIRKSGCMFLCCCYIANIHDIATCDEAWQTCVKNNWVRASDSYCNVSRYNLANKLNGIYNKGIIQGLEFRQNGGHWRLYKGNNLIYSP